MSRGFFAKPAGPALEIRLKNRGRKAVDPGNLGNVRFLERCKIDNVVAECHADSRFATARFETPKGRFSSGKCESLGTSMNDFNGIFCTALYERRTNYAAVIDRRYSKFSARKSSRGSSTLQLPNEVTNFRRALMRSSVISHSRHANTVS